MELKLNFSIYEILIDWIKIEQKLFVLQVCRRFKIFSQPMPMPINLISPLSKSVRNEREGRQSDKLFHEQLFEARGEFECHRDNGWNESMGRYFVRVSVLLRHLEWSARELGRCVNCIDLTRIG